MSGSRRPRRTDAAVDELVASSGNSATFSNLQVGDFIRQITGQATPTMNIHDYDLARERAHHQVG